MYVQTINEQEPLISYEMMKNYLTNAIREKLGIALLSLLATHSLFAQTVYYRFTGTVEGTDPVIGFSSPESVSIGLNAEIGDQVTGSFGVASMGRDIVLDSNPDFRIFFKNVFNFEIALSAQDLLPNRGVAGDSLLLNDRSERVGWVELDPLTSGVADVLTITTPQGGFVGLPWQNLGIALNFTDSTRTVHQGSPDLSEFPQEIDFDRFDVAKGFIRTWLTDSESSDHGIMFNIDSLEEFDPNEKPPIDPPAEQSVPILSKGYHILWKADSADRILESAEFVGGPWVHHKALPLSVKGQNVIGVNTKIDQKLFRLALPPDSRSASDLFYKFTGTVEGLDSVLDFDSPTSPIPGFDAEIGDQVTGTFRVSGFGIKKIPELGSRSISVDAIEDLHVKLNQTELSPTPASRGHFHVGNNIFASGEEEYWDETLLSSDEGDLVTIVTYRLAMGGVASRISFTLNFTDSSATAVGPAGGPWEPIDFTLFDIKKGFIANKGRASERTTQGILFNIDSFEEVDPTPRPVVPIELSMGFHVAWIADAEAYVLEVSETENGPWVPSQFSQENVNGQNIVLMDLNDRARWFRLVKSTIETNDNEGNKIL
jgi:hypothetical protein